MTLEEAMEKILDIFPKASVCSDHEDHLIIFTNLKVEGDDLVEFPTEEA